MRWIDLAKIGFVLAMVLSIVPVLVWLERKVSAFIQGRIGPNRTAVFGMRMAGLFQPLADAVKFIFKEDVVPLRVNRFLYTLAPTLVFVPPAIAFTVIPFGNKWGNEPLIVADVPIGILLLMSVLSISVYGLAFGGWASNNKFSLLGGLRSSAQMISYELTLGLTIITAVMMAGSVNPIEIVEKQAREGWNIVGGGNLWLAPAGIVATLLFYVASLAENNRLPFDLPECDAELVGGYHTEYSSMKFAMFFMGEYVAMVTMSALMVTLWLGGWHFPGLTRLHEGPYHWTEALVSHMVFMVKMGLVLFLAIWIRWTLPRYRYDQLMDLGWKRLVPLALATLVVVGVVGVLTHV
ncbi:MAG: NADH-quinone oxidoreductase subunit NuoH [Planctomycetes bacterium]|nr:NADH-quinone oxidoreductase subunit NuoH [Planctomycetota bacterium]